MSQLHKLIISLKDKIFEILRYSPSVKSASRTILARLKLVFFTLALFKFSYLRRRLFHLLRNVYDICFDWLLVSIQELSTLDIERNHRYPSKEIKNLYSLIDLSRNQSRVEFMKFVKSGIEVNYAERHGSIQDMEKSVFQYLSHLSTISQSNPGLGFRIVDGTFSSSFGHMAHGLEMLLYAKELGYFGSDTILIVSTLSPNTFYLGLWSKHFKFYPLPDRNISTLRGIFPGTFLYMENLPDVSTNLWRFETYNFLKMQHKEKFGSFKSLDFDDQNENLRSWLRTYGIRAHDWFVTYHVRSAKTVGSRSASNAELSSYFASMRVVVEHGGFVVVIGDRSDSVLPFSSKIIDARGIHEVNPFVNIGLLAKCLFAVVTSSGPMSIPPTFGRPVLFTNNPHFRFTFCYEGFHIPKLLYSNSEKRLLTFQELYNHPASWQNRNNFSNEFIRVDNSEDDISMGVIEMINGDYSMANDEVRLRERIGQSLLESGMAIPHNFLSKYSHLT